MIILIASLFLIVVSWRSLWHTGHHGFYRFFAWELILIQIVLNLPFWYRDPLSWYQIISWFLLCMSLYFVYAGFVSLKRYGGERTRKHSEVNYPFENTSKLVSEGIYIYIRHPMYSSLLLLGWGAFFKHPARFGCILSVLSTVCLYVTARIEEKENIRTFGAAYQAYMKKSNMFMPPFF